MSTEKLRYWHYNIPKEERTAECPDYILNLSDKDRGIIGSWDEDYVRITWPEVKGFIRANRIDLFKRVPSELRMYLQFIHMLQQRYGSVIDFIIRERLQWTNPVPKGAHFENPDDIKILYNDWPYGVDEKIVHLVIWTKFHIEVDPDTDDLTPAARKQIDDYVQRTFHTRVNPDHVIWFKNWHSLKSVHAVEHFHVMLYDPDMEFISEITNGDTPMSVQMFTYKKRSDSAAFIQVSGGSQ